MMPKNTRGEERRSNLLRQSTLVRIRGAEVWHYVPNSRLAYTAEHFADVEPEMLDWIDGFERDAVFFDLGASNGLFSVYAAVAAKSRVFAFEPEAQNFATLEVNHFLNRASMAHPIVALNIALSDRTGLGRIYSSRYAAGEHNKILGEPVFRDSGTSFEPEHVQCVFEQCLDKLIVELGLVRPEYIKIDVDGSELPLLQGARETLDEAGVRSVFIEIYRPSDEGREICEMLTGFGFREIKRILVAHPGGGSYPDLYNMVFER